MLRMVDREEWRLSGSLGRERLERLLDPPAAEKLLAELIAEAVRSVAVHRITVRWCRSDENPRYWRTNAQFPIHARIFDQIFNGRSGYRAQYYLSPEEGLLYNRQIIDAFSPIICDFVARTETKAKSDLHALSLAFPHAKIWIVGELDALASEDGTLNPPRWIENSAIQGRKTPLPKVTAIDVKGAWTDPDTQEFWVDETKAARACDLHFKGFS